MKNIGPIAKSLDDKLKATFTRLIDGELDTIAQIVIGKDKRITVQTSFALALDDSRVSIVGSINYSEKFTAMMEAMTEDPDQMKLPIDGEPEDPPICVAPEEPTITLSTPGARPVTMSQQQFTNAVKAVRKKGAKV